MPNNIKIAPSILAADFSRLGEELKAVTEAGADMIHVDVMDGHFVPNITIGPAVVKAVRPATTIPFDVHLMIEHPEKYVDAFAKAGSDIITIHAETTEDIPATLAAIRATGCRTGLSINPPSELSLLMPYLDDVDMVLLMTVNPGFGGQFFIRNVLPKIKTLRETYTGDIEVDGGINGETVREAVAAGANIIVAGTHVFGGSDYKERIDSLRV